MAAPPGLKLIAKQMLMEMAGPTAMSALSEPELIALCIHGSLSCDISC